MQSSEMLAVEEQQLLVQYRQLSQAERTQVQTWAESRPDQLLMWFAAITVVPGAAISEYEPLLLR